MAIFFLCRLQGTCLKGDSCEFSHIIDVQEVANKIVTPTTPKKEQPQPSFDTSDYPQLSATPLKSVMNTSIATTIEDEFPSLASASKIKKVPAVKGAINFAEAAKKKGATKVTRAKTKKSTKRPGYSLQKLKQPVHIPWLDTGSTLNSIYMKEVIAKIYLL